MNIQKGLVSINILTWNSEKYIKTCLEHCLTQDYKNYEIIVIDNNSSDNTLNICAEFLNKIKVIKNNSNIGYSGGHNVGIRVSKAEYILVLNPDVFLSESYVKNIVDFLDKNPDYGGGIGTIFQYNANNKALINKKYIDTTGLRILKSRQFIAMNFNKISNQIPNDTLECFGLDGMAALYRKRMLEKIKIMDEYFDEDFFAYCEDQDLSWRCRLAGWKFAFVPESEASHVRTWKPKSLKYRKAISSATKKNAVRNHYFAIIKNDNLILFLLHSPFILLRFFKIFIYSAIFEQRTLLAFYELFVNRKKMIIKRKSIKKIRKTNIIDAIKWYKL